MKVVKRYKIGSVDLTQLEGADIDSSRYSDGDSEKVLYDIFSSDTWESKVKKTLKNNPPWPIYYHLSPYRKNVIDWYSFEDDARVLEIGAGCGAITEALCNKNIKVTALELTKRRAEINAHRNKTRSNLDIVVGNLEDYKPSTKFDYIVCIGVLEYAGMFINSSNPYEDFVNNLSEFLSPNGKLIIAIENRLGLKYLSGAREDHTGHFFDGINQYPYPKKVQTFGRLELKELIEDNGFARSSFFYPYPDYKNPMLIYSDEYYPGTKTEFPIKLLPASSFDQHNRSRVHLFSEQLAMMSLEQNQLYKDLANSFVIIANKDSKINDTKLYYTSTPNRKEAYQLDTYLKKNTKGQLKFYKEARSLKSQKHLSIILDNYTKLKNIFSKSSIRIVEAKKINENILEFDFVEGKSLERLLFESIVNHDYEASNKIIDKFIAAAQLLPGEEETDDYLIDLNFDNIIVDKDGVWNFIDYEWLIQRKAAKDLIVQRALIYFINRYAHAFKYLANRGDFACIAKGWFVPESIYNKHLKYFKDLDTFSKYETEFQTLVNENFNSHPVINKEMFNSPTKAEVAQGLVETYLSNLNKLKDQTKHINQLNQSNEYLSNELGHFKHRARRAELTSPYYLTKKVARRVKFKLKNK